MGPVRGGRRCYAEPTSRRVQIPNGTDCSNLLQTEPLVVPTQWLVVDCTHDGRSRDWFRDDEDTVDWVGLRHRGEPSVPSDADAIKRAVIRSRPRATRKLLKTFRSRRAMGSSGRLVIWVVGDLTDPLSRALLLELPIDLSNLAFWESGFVPAVVRAAIGRDAGARRSYLSQIQHQYWGQPDFSLPYYGLHRAEQLYANEFDATLLCPDDAALSEVVSRLLPLHVRETLHAREHPGPTRAGGMIVIEDTLEASRAWRGIDWLAMALYPYFKRLWDTERDDILEILDYERCPARAEDPWAAVKGRARERSWSDRDLDPDAKFDHYHLEDSYRVTPGDHATRLALARFLYERQQHREAMTHCVLGSEESAASFEPAWLKLEGLVRLGLGEVERGRELVLSYRDTLKIDPDPSPSVMDEIATMALVLREWDEARAWALRALEEDPHLLHAYDTLVLTARTSGKTAWEEEARQLAEDHDVQVPLHVREQTERVLRKAREARDEDDAERQRQREQEGPLPPGKWWQFWKR